MASGKRRRWRRAVTTSLRARNCSTTPLRTRSKLGGKLRKVQTASAVLCYSRMLFFQLYPTFQRFDCKVFLTEALRYFDGATGQRVMIDNTHVVVLRGTGGRWFRCRRWRPLPNVSASASRLMSWATPTVRRASSGRSLYREQLPGGPHLRRVGRI